MIELENRPTYVQITIYNRSIGDFEQKGIQLIEILKDIGCESFWVGEGVICKDGSKELIPDSSPCSHVDVETTKMIDGTGLLSTTVADVKFPRCSTPIVSKRWPSFNMLPSGISNIFRVPSHDESEHFSISEAMENKEIEENVRDVLENIIQKLEAEYSFIERTPHSERSPPLKRSRTSFPNIPAYNLLEQLQSTTSLPSEESNSSQVVQKTTERRTAVKRESTAILNVTAEEPVYQQLYNHPFSDTGLSTHQPQSYQSSSLRHEEVEYEKQFGGKEDCGMEDTEFMFTPQTSPAIPKERKVSFAIPAIPNVKEMIRCRLPNSTFKPANEHHLITCQFDGCREVIKWRPKFGKLRFVDHVSRHLAEKMLKCQLCSHQTMTTRAMKYHYKKIHPEAKMRGFGMRDIEDRPEQLKFMWQKCFSSYISLIGNLQLKEDLKKRKKKSEKSVK